MTSPSPERLDPLRMGNLAECWGRVRERAILDMGWGRYNALVANREWRIQDARQYPPSKANPADDVDAITSGIAALDAALTALSSERARDRERIKELEVERDDWREVAQALAIPALKAGHMPDGLPVYLTSDGRLLSSREAAALGNPQSSMGLGQGEGNG